MEEAPPVTGAIRLLPGSREAKSMLAQALALWGRMYDGRTDPGIAYRTCNGEAHFTIPVELFVLYGDLPFTSEGVPIEWYDHLYGQETKTVHVEDFPDQGPLTPLLAGSVLLVSYVAVQES